MQTKTSLTLALMALAMLVGWIAAGERNRVGAQVIEMAKPEHCYEIPWDIKLDGRNVLLNRCTGDSWRFPDTRSGWQRITKN